MESGVIRGPELSPLSRRFVVQAADVANRTYLGNAWLDEPGRRWLSEHAEVLDAVFTELEADGRWPDPVELERKLRSRGTRIGVVPAVRTIPASLGWHVTYPSAVSLTIFGLACVPRAEWVLDAYLATLQLALTKFDNPAVSARLSRPEVQTHLGLDDHRMEVVSTVFLDSAVFFGGGSSSVAAWAMDIDPRVVAYDEISTVHELITRLSAERLARVRIRHEPETAGSRSGGEDRRDWLSPAAISLGLLGLASDAMGVGGSPAPVIGIVLGGGLASLLLHRVPWFRRDPRRTISGVIVGMCAGGGTAWLVAPAAEEPLSVRAQVDRVIRVAATDRRHVVVDRAIRFRGPAGSPSRLLVFRDDVLPSLLRGDITVDDKEMPTPPRSDEVRVYDVAGRKITLGLRFRPQDPGLIRQAPEGDYPAFTFEETKVDDFDLDGRTELVGSFNRITLATGPLPVPVLLGWSSAAGAYRLTPLVPLRYGPAAQSPGFRPNPAGTKLKDYYSPVAFAAGSTDVFSVLARKTRPVVATGDRVYETDGSQGKLIVRATSVDLKGNSLDPYQCELGSSKTRRVVPGEPDESALERTVAAIHRFAEYPCDL